MSRWFMNMKWIFLVLQFATKTSTSKQDEPALSFLSTVSHKKINLFFDKLMISFGPKSAFNHKIQQDTEQISQHHFEFAWM